MKRLTYSELEEIKAHLIKKPFKYEEVYHEVVDHYASAYEQSEEDLSTVFHTLDQEFTPNKIQSIESKFFSELRKSLRKSQWSLFLGNFKWPRLISTLLCATALVLLAPFAIKFEWLGKGLFIFLAFTPLLFGLYFYFKWLIRRVRGKTIHKNAHAELSGMAVGFSLVYAQLPNMVRIFVGDFQVLLNHPNLTAAVLFLGVILLFTSIKMINLKIKPALN